jgi:hypothetical protein
MKIPQRKLLSAAIILALAAGSAHAMLERVGPIGNATTQGGYPAWYQDTTGIAVEFCDPHPEELANGWCLLLPGDVNAPENLAASNFFDEHFYFAAGSALTPATGGTAGLVLAVEGAFSADVVPGGQITFSRIRFRMTSVPMTGKYRFIHPYGENTEDGVAGERIFFTDDIGIGAPGDFTGATQSRLGPFLLPADAAGGPELPAVAGPVAGKKYIADPARNGPVTGSTLPDFIDSTGTPRNHNIFRIEGPAGSNIGGVGIDWLESTDFTLMGRVFDGAVAGKVDVDRASYSGKSGVIKLDVFATAFETAPTRLPATPKPLAVVPQLTFFNAACSGTVDAAARTIHPPYGVPVPMMGDPVPVETQIFATGSKYWGQVQVANVPDYVCVKDLTARDVNGNLTPAFFLRKVTDLVTVTRAEYDVDTGALDVKATSSDDMIGPDKLTVLVGTQAFSLASVPPILPGTATALIAVRSENGERSSSTQFPVSTVTSASSGSHTPVALNDLLPAFNEGSSATFDVLANDKHASGGMVTITAQPRLGAAVVNADGTILFAPTNSDVNGADALTYTVTVDGKISNTAVANFTINPVNDNPVGVNDSANVTAGLMIAINVLANDTDVDGPADIVAAAQVSAPRILPVGAITPAGTSAVYDPATRKVNFLAPSAGTYTFTYKPQDIAGAVADIPATVTVQVIAVEALQTVKAQFLPSQNVGGTTTTKWIAQGSTNVIGSQIIDAYLVVNGVENPLKVGTSPVAADGSWQIQAIGGNVPIAIKGQQNFLRAKSVVVNPDGSKTIRAIAPLLAVKI